MIRRPRYVQSSLHKKGSLPLLATAQICRIRVANRLIRDSKSKSPTTVRKPQAAPG